MEGVPNFLMKINLFMITFLSTPEAFLNLVLILLFAEQKFHLSLNMQNCIRFFTALILMLTASWFLRPLAPNTAISMVYHIIAYILIIMIIYKVHYGTAALSVTTIMLFMATMENTFIPFVITYINKGENAFFNSDMTMLLCSIPVRALQTATIYPLSKYNHVFEITRLNQRNRILFAVCNLIIIVCEMFFSSTFVQYFDTMTMPNRIIYAVALIMLAITFYILLFSFMWMTLEGVVRVGYKRYQQLEYTTKKNYEKLEKNYEELEDAANGAFKELHDLLKNQNNIDGAINLLEELICSEESKDNSRESKK